VLTAAASNSDTDQRRRRREIDRLLAVRLATLAGHDQLADAIRPMATSDDAFLARAAQRYLHVVADEAAPAAIRPPPLGVILERIPRDCHLVAVIDSHRFAGDRDVGAALARGPMLDLLMLRHLGMNEAYQTFESVVVSEIRSESPVPLAVEHGNLRIDRLVVALHFRDQEEVPAFHMFCDGVFTAEQAEALYALLPNDIRRRVDTTVFAANRCHFDNLTLVDEPAHALDAQRRAPFLQHAPDSPITATLDSIPTAWLAQGPPGLAGLQSGELVMRSSAMSGTTLSLTVTAHDEQTIGFINGTLRMGLAGLRQRRGEPGTEHISLMTLISPAIFASMAEPAFGQSVDQEENHHLTLELTWPDHPWPRLVLSAYAIPDWLATTEILTAADPSAAVIDMLSDQADPPAEQ